MPLVSVYMGWLYWRVSLGRHYWQMPNKVILFEKKDSNVHTFSGLNADSTMSISQGLRVSQGDNRNHIYYVCTVYDTNENEKSHVVQEISQTLIIQGNYL